MIIYSIGLGYFLNYFKSKIFICFLAGIILTENVTFAMTEYPYKKDQRTTDMLTAELAKYDDKMPFLWEPAGINEAGHLPIFFASNAAMWAALESGHPTLNGTAQTRMTNLFPQYDPDNPETLYNFDLVQRLKEPFILIESDDKGISSRIIPPPTAMQVLKEILNSTLPAYSPKSMAIIYGEADEEVFESIKTACPESMLDFIRADLEKAILLNDYVKYDFILILGNHKISGVPFLTFTNLAEYRLFANRLAFDFSRMNDFYPIRVMGLSGKEPEGRWSDVKTVAFFFPCPLPSNFELSLDAFASIQT